METIEIISIELTYQQQTKELSFSKAELIVLSDYGSKLWYVDVSEVEDRELLRWFGQSEDIEVKLQLLSRDGRSFHGAAYFHPNEPHQAAAIRGEGILHEG